MRSSQYIASFRNTKIEEAEHEYALLSARKSNDNKIDPKLSTATMHARMPHGEIKQLVQQSIEDESFPIMARLAEVEEILNQTSR